MQRRIITLTFLVVGVLLVFVSYFFLSAPIGSSGVKNSNPRMQFAPALLVFGVILAFSSAIVYELLPGSRKDSPEDGEAS